MFAHPICNCLITPTHFFFFFNIVCNAACMAGEWLSCKSLDAHQNCFLNHSRPSILSNPSSRMLGALQIGLVCLYQQFSYWMAKWHCITGTVNERALHNREASTLCILLGQTLTASMQPSPSKDLRNSEVWSVGTFMPRSLARETSAFEIG